MGRRRTSPIDEAPDLRTGRRRFTDTSEALGRLALEPDLVRRAVLAENLGEVVQCCRPVFGSLSRGQAGPEMSPGPAEVTPAPRDEPRDVGSRRSVR